MAMNQTAAAAGHLPAAAAVFYDRVMGTCYNGLAKDGGLTLPIHLGCLTCEEASNSYDEKEDENI